MKRLIDGEVALRDFVPADKHRLAELANNKKVSDNLRDGFPNPYTVADAQSFIEMCLSLTPPQIFAIEYYGVYAGNIGLHKGDDVYRKSAEIGYFLGELFWNKGIMTKAVNLICDYGFNNLDIVRIFTGVFHYNISSQKVLEKCGFIKEGVFKDAIFKNGIVCNEIRHAKLLHD